MSNDANTGSPTSAGTEGETALNHRAHLLRNRTATIPIILDEVLRLRKEQDDRLGHYQRVAGLLLGIFIPVSGLAALGIINLEGQFHGVSAAVSAVFAFIFMMLSLFILLPPKWGVGPSIPELINRAYMRGEDLHHVHYGLTISHFRRLTANEDTLKTVRRSFVAAIACFVVAVSVLAFGPVRYDEPMQSPEPNLTAEAAESVDGSNGESSESWPDLPDFELHYDTYAERGVVTKFYPEDQQRDIEPVSVWRRLASRIG